MNANSLNLHLDIDQVLIPREVPAQRVLEIQLLAPQSSSIISRPALNLALVLDRSGSMDGEKLAFVKQAALHVLDCLRETDRAALVAYDDEVNLLAHSVPMTKENRAELRHCVQAIQTGGSTNLSGGWLTGCQEAAAAARDGSLNRALLLTDGLANVGIQEPEALAGHARELAIRGVSTSTFGVGRGFNEHLLEGMSNQGGGNFYYIETPSEIPAIFQREFKELAAVTARDVEIMLDLPPQVHAQVLGGWRFEQRDGQMRIFLGSLTSGREQEIYLKLLTPPASGAAELRIQARVLAKGEGEQAFEEQAEAAFRYASQAEAEAAPRSRPVLERFAHVDLAETANEALKLERRGENQKADQMLRSAVAAAAPFVAPSVAKEYEQMSERMKQGMDEDDRKQSHFRVYRQKRQREE
jgi:Ca-activated chloride channel family protein